MSITLQFGNPPAASHALRWSREGNLVLPALTMTPTASGDDRPELLLREIAITTPDDAPPGLRRAITRAYRTDQLELSAPLSSVRSIEARAVRIDPPQRDVEFELRAELTYSLAGDPSPERVAVGSCTLRWSPSEMARLTCTWTQPFLVVGLQPAVLSIRVAETPAAFPVIRLARPDAIPLTELRDHLTQALKTAVTATPKSGYEAHISLPHLGAAMTRLIELTSDAPLRIPLRVAMADWSGPEEAPETEVNLRVECQQARFPGHVAIDFGTTSSTVTLYDPGLNIGRAVAPPEQVDTLRRSLLDWLRSKNPVPSRLEREWLELMASIAEAIARTPATRQLTDHELVLATLATEDGAHQITRALELRLVDRACPPDLRLFVDRRLTAIYRQVFRVFPFRRLRLQPVELDLDRNLTEIPSELRIVELTSPLGVEMGVDARNARLLGSQGRDVDPATADQNVFYPSAKQFYDELAADSARLDVRVGGESASITKRELVQAAWHRLLQLTNELREHRDGELSSGRFRDVIITYPVTVPMNVRDAIAEMAREIGVDRPVTLFDEAISAALFFLVEELNGDLEVGLEAFRTLCRPVRSAESEEVSCWRQTVLVVDVGGGTTDVALLQFQLEELDPFAELDADERSDRGAGGRYFRITPRLLGATGHPQLGGELITLRLYHTLKRKLADTLLTHLSDTRDGGDDTDLPLDLLNTLDEELVDGDRYRAGALLAPVDWERPQRSVAFRAANQVLRTDWQRVDDPVERDRRKSSFATLWQLAETAKLYFARERPDGESAPPFPVRTAELTSLLERAGFKPESLGGDAIVELDEHEFAEVVRSAMDQVSEIAVRLLESRFKELRATDGVELDRVILAGKTCNASLVRKLFADKLTQRSRPETYVWNRERLTFSAAHAKQATSIGACYAERVRTGNLDPRHAVDRMLRRGDNMLHIDVDNLFFNLPCGFRMQVAGSASGWKEVFPYNCELSDRHGDALGSARTPDWLPPAIELNLDRVDYEGGVEKHWANFKCQALLQALGMDEDQFKRDIGIQFEVDHSLRIDVLFHRRDQPLDLSVPGDLASASLLETLRRDASPVAAPDDASPLTPYTSWVLGVSIHPDHRPEDLTTLAAGSLTDVVRIESEDVVRRGRLLALPPGGSYTVFVSPDVQPRDWRYAATLTASSNSTSRNPSFHLLLDEAGDVRLHEGPVPYWETSTITDLVDTGRVYRSRMNPMADHADEQRDPLCGVH